MAEIPVPVQEEGNTAREVKDPSTGKPDLKKGFSEEAEEIFRELYGVKPSTIYDL